MEIVGPAPSVRVLHARSPPAHWILSTEPTAMQLRPRPRSSFAALAFLPALSAAPALAQSADAFVVCTGDVVSVLGSGLTTGPLAGAAAGDAFHFVLSLEALSPPAGQGEALYAIRRGIGRVELGSRTSNVAAPPFSVEVLVGNDVNFPGFPTTDYFFANTALPSGGSVQVLLEDAIGSMFDSNDLTQLVGGYAATGGSYARVLEPSGTDGVDIDLLFVDVEPSGPVGSSFCTPPAANSTGALGRLTAIGSDRADVGVLELVAGDLPSGQFSLFLASAQQSAPTALVGSVGTLCLATPGRYVSSLGPIDGLGSARLRVDLDALPTPSGPVQANPGETWSFQCWHRDVGVGGATSNLTEGRSVLLR